MQPPTESSNLFELFSVPQYLPVANDQSQNVWQTKASEVFNGKIAERKTHAASKILACCERGKNHWHGTVGDEADVSTWPWNCVPIFFADRCGTKPIMHLVRHWCQDNRKEIVPLAMQRQAVQVIQGQLVVVVVDCLFMRQHSDIDAYLKDGHHACLQ